MLRPSADEAMKSKWFRPEDNTRRSSLDQTKGQLGVERVHRLSTSKERPDLSHISGLEADLTSQLMPEVAQPLTTTRVALKDDFHPTNPFVLSSSPLSSVARQKIGATPARGTVKRTNTKSTSTPPKASADWRSMGRQTGANPAPGTIKRTDTESTSTKASGDRPSGTLPQVSSVYESKLTKLTKEGPFASETEFCRLDFGTWVSQDSTSTISPATVVKDGYIGLDKSTNKELKVKDYGFDGSYSKDVWSTENEMEVFKVGEENTKEKYTHMRKPNATVSDELSTNDIKVFTENEREVVNVEMKGDYYKSIDNEASLSNPLASGIQQRYLGSERPSGLHHPPIFEYGLSRPPTRYDKILDNVMSIS
jgi:hypothetical protein